MRSLLPILVLGSLAAVVACSPQTDITETSTELAAGRTPYRVVNEVPEPGGVLVQIEVTDLGAAERVARDVILRKRSTGLSAIDVWIYPAGQAGSQPRARLHWSAAHGFRYSAHGAQGRVRVFSRTRS